MLEINRRPPPHGGMPAEVFTLKSLGENRQLVELAMGEITINIAVDGESAVQEQRE